VTDQTNKQSRSRLYAHRHPRGKAKTSARAIKQRQREADVLTYRLHGHAYEAIDKKLNLSVGTAYNYAVRALQRIVPVEDAKAVLRMELARLDALEAAVFSEAGNGDIPSIDACLRIQNQRCRLMGLFPDSKGGGVHVNVGTSDVPDARTAGIQITFVPGPAEWQALDGEVLPALEHQPAAKIKDFSEP